MATRASTAPPMGRFSAGTAPLPDEAQVKARYTVQAELSPV